MIKCLLCFLFMIMLYCGASAQDNSTHSYESDTTTVASTAGETTDEPDDEFNIFLIVIGVGFIGAALGAVMAGAFAVFLLLGVAVLLTVAGILSASLLIGLYKRSLQAGFKSFVLIVAGILGSVIGLVVTGLFNYYFHLQLSGYQMILAGAGGGLSGGLLLGLIIYKMIKLVLKTALTKLKLMN